MQNKKYAPRAQIFLPFDSLKGFRELLKEKERVVVPKKELSEDALVLLDYTFSQVQKGSMVRVVYEDGNDHVEVEGLVAKIDREFMKIIRIVDLTIEIKRIVEIEIINDSLTCDKKVNTL